VAGIKELRTVEESCPVDAASGFGSLKIPHLVEWPALADSDYEADEKEDTV
jgi:hypothetical protein